MAYGLQIFDATGAVMIDTSTRLGRVMGSFATGTSNGSLDVTTLIGAWPGGTLWASLVNSRIDQSIKTPGIIVSGTVISWTFDSNVNNPATAQSSTVLYGMF